MSELQDFDLEPTEESQKRGPLTGPMAIAVGVIVLAVIGFFVWRWSQQRRGARAGRRSCTGGRSAGSPRVRCRRRQLRSIFPRWRTATSGCGRWWRSSRLTRSCLAWLATDDLIRRFVVVVDNLAEGVSPRTHLEFLEPEKGFGTRDAQSRVFVDDSAYQRYDNASGCDRLHRCARDRQSLPLGQAPATGGVPGAGLPQQGLRRQAMLEAIDTLLRTPVVDGPIELVPKVSSFEFADPKLEELSDAEKHFLRLGPDNLRKIQAKARAIALEIGLPQARASPRPGDGRQPVTRLRAVVATVEEGAR